MSKADVVTKELGYTEFTDSRSDIHKIKHSIVLSDSEKRELEDSIVEELYRIFTYKTAKR